MSSPHRLREAFPAGLATSRADFERQLAALPQPDLASLGDYVMRTDLKGGGAVEVKQATLCSAHPSIKVRRQGLPHCRGDPATLACRVVVPAQKPRATRQPTSLHDMQSPRSCTALM